MYFVASDVNQNRRDEKTGALNNSPSIEGKMITLKRWGNRIPGQLFQSADQHYDGDLAALEQSYPLLEDLRPFSGIVIVEKIVPVIAEALNQHLPETR